jgi:excisionase family DNA binding protein
MESNITVQTTNVNNEAEMWKRRAETAENMLANIHCLIQESKHSHEHPFEEVPAEIKKEAYEFRKKRTYNKFLTVAQAAEIIGVSAPTVYNYIHTGQINASRIGDGWRIRESVAKDFVRPVAGNPGIRRKEVRDADGSKDQGMQQD